MATLDNNQLRLRVLREAITKFSNGYDLKFTINRAFETTGCSCHPLRQELEQLETQCAYLKAEKERQLEDNPTVKRRNALRQQIMETDRREHPTLDTQAQAALPFLRVWLFDQLVSPGADLVDLSKPQELAERFAKEWLSGWRP